MKKGRINIGSIRREQIVDSAVAVIAEQGIQNLSLSEIEKKVGMSRGQLTYYYKTKEEILLAVFDRMLQLMCEQHGEAGPAHPFADLDWLEIVGQLLHMVLQDPPPHPEFHALQYTFLSQISHREDFRQRLADLYEGWRQHGAADVKREMKQRTGGRKVSPRALATLAQALIHGLAMQKAADPSAIDADEMVPLCLAVLNSYLGGTPTAKKLATRQPTKKRREGSHERNGK